MSEWGKIWHDQYGFNRKFRPDPETDAERAEQVKDIALLMQSEIHELLQTVAWKKHRKDTRHRPNMAHSHEELTDIFKYFVTLCNLFDVTPEALQRLYWAKSAVCEQRYVEEWVSDYARGNLRAKVAIVDLDNVIFDYIDHFGNFLYLQPLGDDVRLTLIRLIGERKWISAESTGIPVSVFEAYKHTYRTSGAKAHLPLMPYAKEFMQALRGLGYVIIVVTSRPIDRYPNLMMDTIASLNRHGLPYDHVWHGPSKKTVLVERLSPMPSQIFAIDDDPKYVQEYVSLGIPVFHVLNGGTTSLTQTVGRVPVADLEDALNCLHLIG